MANANKHAKRVTLVYREIMAGGPERLAEIMAKEPHKLEVADSHNVTPLHRLAFTGPQEILMTLLRKGNAKMLGRMDSFGGTVIGVIAVRGGEEARQEISKNEAMLGIKGRHGVTIREIIRHYS